MGGSIYRSYLFSTDIIDPNTLQLAFELNNNKITGDKVIHALNEATNNILQQTSFIKEIQDRFRVGGFYDWHGIRYFLFEYNLDLQERSRTGRAKIMWPEFIEQKTDFVSVEHIYPQQARHQYWTSRFDGLSQKQRTALRNSLGNLLPLSKPKNSSLSNKPFPEKVDGKTERVVGYRYGCYAENEVAQIAEWTPQEILKRGLILLKFMEKRWGLQFGDEQQKKYMLGVEFMS